MCLDVDGLCKVHRFVLSVRKGVGEGVKVMGKSMCKQGKIMRLNNLISIKFRGVVILVIYCHWGDVGWKVKHQNVTLWCLISCDTGIMMQLLLKRMKVVYTISST